MILLSNCRGFKTSLPGILPRRHHSRCDWKLKYSDWRHQTQSCLESRVVPQLLLAESLSRICTKTKFKCIARSWLTFSAPHKGQYMHLLSCCSVYSCVIQTKSKLAKSPSHWQLLAASLVLAVISKADTELNHFHFHPPVQAQYSVQSFAIYLWSIICSLRIQM